MTENKSKPDKKGPGVHSLREILSQPSCWTSCLNELRQTISACNMREIFGQAREWIFVGCGSSYYIALAAASSWSVVTGQRARAVPASELLLFPDLTLTGSIDIAAVVISRSGRTSEALSAGDLLRKRGIRTLGVTCSPEEMLQQIATRTITLLPAHEESTVMTRSFTSMLLALQYTAAYLAGDDAFLESLHKMASHADSALSLLHPQIRDFVNSHKFADYICLGQGPFYGPACECALKLGEMSVSYAQSYHTLEFRHGPKSVVSPETAILFLISQTGYDAECTVLEETKAQGGTTVTIVDRADDRVRASSDLLVEFGFDLPELAWLAPSVFVGQLMGLYTGLKKGLDPDSPRNLSRVVILGEGESEKEHAAL